MSDLTKPPATPAQGDVAEAEKGLQPESWAELCDDVARKQANNYVFRKLEDKITIVNISTEAWKEAMNLVGRPLFRENEALKQRVTALQAERDALAARVKELKAIIYEAGLSWMIKEKQ